MMLYLDLAEMDRVFGLSRWWSNSLPAPAWFRRRDYLGDPSRPLDACIRDEVEANLGERPAGSIRMLTHPRYFGFGMNPITTYFVFGPDGNEVQAVVAEVTNTPWREKHVYVWPAEALVPRLGTTGHRCPKQFHVSPFMHMDQTYHVRIVHRSTGLIIRLDAEIGGHSRFHAQLTLRKRTVTAATLRRAVLRYPFMTAQVFTRIYVQAFHLWRKKVPFFPHPKTKESDIYEHTHVDA
jgi:DUF1365 family protein